MDFRSEALAELARDASLERSDFLVRAGEQLERFMKANEGRIRSLGGLILLDSDDEYLAVAPDGTFRSRSRVYDEDTGDWVSETEIIEAAAELVELYNPADVFAAFVEAAENAEAEGGGDDVEGDVGDDGLTIKMNGEDPYAAAADRWAAGQPEGLAEPEEDDGTDEAAARRLYDLALDFQEKSQLTEGRLLAQFEEAAAGYSARLGEIVITEDDDERLVLATGAKLRASVLSEESGSWEALEEPAQLVEYYDPTDVFSDLADAIAEAWPNVAPPAEGAEEAEGAEAPAEAEGGTPA